MAVKPKAVKTVSNGTAKPVVAKSMKKQVKKKVTKPVKAKKAKIVAEETEPLKVNAKKVKSDVSAKAKKAEQVAEEAKPVKAKKAKKAKPVKAKKAEQVAEEAKLDENRNQATKINPKENGIKPVKTKKVKQVKKVKEMDPKKNNSKLLKAKKVDQVKNLNPQKKEGKPLEAMKSKKINNKGKLAKVSRVKQTKKLQKPKQINQKERKQVKLRKASLVVQERPSSKAMILRAKKNKLVMAKKVKLAKAKAELLRGMELKLPKVVSRHKTTSLEDELEEGSGITKTIVTQAIEGVRVLEKERNEKRKKDLLADTEDDTLIFLQVCLMKVSEMRKAKKHVIRPVKIKIPMPNAPIGSNTNVLVIAQDNRSAKYLRADYSENLQKYQDLLRRCGAARHITEVMTLTQLKTEYKEYEAKRRLAKRIDIVLCDDTILRRIPMFLGKAFYKARKQPRPINLKAKNLLKEVEDCLFKEILEIPMTGTSCIMKIGRLGQTNEMVTENIRSAVRVMLQKIPGGWANVQRLHLKTSFSESVPFYVKMRSCKYITPIKPKRLYKTFSVTGEVSTMGGDLFTVTPDCRVFFKRTAEGEQRTKEEIMAMLEKENPVVVEMEPDSDSQIDDVVEGEATGTKSKALKEKRKKMDEGTEAQIAKKKKSSTSLQDVTAKKKKKTTGVVAGNKENLVEDVVAKDKKAMKELATKDSPMKDNVTRKNKKLKNKKINDMDIDFDDDLLDRMESEYLKSLSAEQENLSDGKAVGNLSDNEEDDWAEVSDEDEEEL